jgi:hypothetical protein
MIYVDTETVGFHGVPVLLQYAVDDGPIQLYDIWRNPIRETIELFEWIASQDVCGFNLAFDWFHIYKLYTMLIMIQDQDVYPEDIIDELGIIEEQARFSDICLKPKSCCDIMLHARKGKYQTLMDRDDIRIRKIPTAMAWLLAEELERRIKFDDIYFAKSKDFTRWKIYDRNDGTDFKDIKLKFKASGALKNLAIHALKIPREEILFHSQVELPKKARPAELGYAPFALAIAKYFHINGDWSGTWPQKIREHILHWGFKELPRKYAADDIVYTRRLHKEVFDNVAPGDDDSELTAMVACVRWSGYTVNANLLKELRERTVEKIEAIPFHSAPKKVKQYLREVMSDVEALVLESTKKVLLEEIAERWKQDDGSPHPASIRAREVLDARGSKKEKELYDKILLANRFHADFKVIGALSTRMAGASGLNAQGIKHQTFVRKAFTLAGAGLVLCGGDFKSYEVSIADVVFDDPKLHQDLLDGVKIHAVFGQMLFPEYTYEEVRASEGKDPDIYDKGKKGVFAIFYGGESYTLQTRLGVTQENADNGYNALCTRYNGIRKMDITIRNDHQALTQPKGIGTKVEYKVPKDYVESFFGFKRYFTLENQIVKALFDLAQNPPHAFKQVAIKVRRTDRVQTASGATQSALYGAAFAVQGSIVRAAKNHKIQSPGGQMAKGVQRAIWNLQPSGVHQWIVKPFNVHDEIMCPTRIGYEKQVEEAAQNKVMEYRAYVPLLAIDWLTNIPNWAGKKG